MLTSIYDKDGLALEINEFNKDYIIQRSTRESGMARIIACRPLPHKYDNTVWFIVRCAHRIKTSRTYMRSPSEMTRGARQIATQHQDYYIVRRYDYVVVSADMHTGKVTEHEVHTNRDTAIKDMRTRAGIETRNYGGRKPRELFQTRL